MFHNRIKVSNENDFVLILSNLNGQVDQVHAGKI